MTDISLPYDQVREIIQAVADDYAPSVPKSRQVGMPMTSIFAQHGHTLWYALEKAHLAKTKGEIMAENKTIDQMTANDWRGLGNFTFNLNWEQVVARMEKAEAQRDALLAACEAYEAHSEHRRLCLQCEYDCHEGLPLLLQARKLARDAIAKVTQ